MSPMKYLKEVVKIDTCKIIPLSDQSLYNALVIINGSATIKEVFREVEIQLTYTNVIGIILVDMILFAGMLNKSRFVMLFFDGSKLDMTSMSRVGLDQTHPLCIKTYQYLLTEYPEKNLSYCFSDKQLERMRTFSGIEYTASPIKHPLDSRTLLLQKLTESDDDLLYRIFSTEEHTKYTIYKILTNSEEISQFKEMLKDPNVFWFTVFDHNQKIGICNLRKHFSTVDITKHTTSISYYLSPEYVGQGYATEIASKLLYLAGTDKGCYKITAMAHPSNFASLRVLHKVGFTSIGISHHHLIDHKGQFQDRMLLELPTNLYPQLRLRGNDV